MIIRRVQKQQAETEEPLFPILGATKHRDNTTRTTLAPSSITHNATNVPRVIAQLVNVNRKCRLYIDNGTKTRLLLEFP